MAGWSTRDMPRQDGRLAVVTGANSGIGLEAARELARAGASVVLACRNAEKAAAALAALRADAPAADVTVLPLDLGSLASVRAFAARVTGDLGPVHLLVNNAGVMAPPRTTTQDGFELQIGTNHLGHFALTGLLLSKLDAGARVVTVSSGAHRVGEIRFDDLHGEQRYSRWGAYGQSKLANLLFMAELDRRLRGSGSAVRSIAAHPGYAATNLQFAVASPWAKAWMRVANVLFAQSAARGALPTLYAATHPDVEGGMYIGPQGLFEMRGSPGSVERSDRSHDADAAARLWALSEELTGVRFAL